MTRQSTYNKIMTRMTLLPFCLLVLITNFSHAQTEKRVQPNPDMELQPVSYTHLTLPTKA